MIQSNELRIGNIVNINGVTVQLGTELFCLVVTNQTAPPKPIILSPEILEKVEGVAKFNNFFILPNMYLGFITTDENYQMEVKVSGIDVWNIIDIKYLHELQNAYYFFNNGEELQITL